MANAPAKPLMTADELLNLPDDGNRYELSEGELICMSPAGGESPEVASEVFFRMRLFVTPAIGRCGMGELGFRLAFNPDTVRAPDVWFVSRGRYPDAERKRGFWQLAPDLAVEVLSPSNLASDMLKKIDEYLSLGVRLVWVIDPESRRAWVFRAGRATVVVLEDGSLDGEDVIPGFRLPLADVLNV